MALGPPLSGSHAAARLAGRDGLCRRRRRRVAGVEQAPRCGAPLLWRSDDGAAPGAAGSRHGALRGEGAAARRGRLGRLHLQPALARCVPCQHSPLDTRAVWLPLPAANSALCARTPAPPRVPLRCGQGRSRLSRALQPPGLSFEPRSVRLTNLRLGRAGAAAGSAGAAPGGRAAGVLRLSLEALQRYLTTGPAARACRRAAALLGGAGRSDGAGGLPVAGCTSCKPVRRAGCRPAARPVRPRRKHVPTCWQTDMLTQRRCGRRAACRSCRRCSTA